MPPEFQAAFGSALKPHAIHRCNKNAICNRMRTLNSPPGVELRGAELLLLRWMPANRRGIEKNIRPAQARKARPFRIPLVPAHQHADAREMSIEIRKSQVAGREIEFFVVKWIVRNMHLAIFAERRPVGVNRNSRIVINSRRPPLEKRSDDNDVQAA